jgi:hypothetical protein
MFWTSIGALTAAWLMLAPALWPEQVASSWLAAAVGVVALPLTVLGVVAPAVRRTLGWLGLVLGVGNFLFLDGSLGAIASYAISGILLVGAGSAPGPEPVLEPLAAVAPEPQTLVEPELSLAA